MSEITIMINVGAPAEEIAALEAVLERYDLDGDVNPGFMGFDLSFHDYVTIVTVLLVKDFVSGFAGAAGTEAWTRFRDFFREIATARRPDGTPVDIRLEGGRTRIHFSTTAPDDAYRAFTDGTFREGYWYQWDPRNGEWHEIDPKYPTEDPGDSE